ncbi:N1221-domain-containing protein [Xylariaceae sp. FL0255]|nr:N1221-domain-containing protein [Xylariaceae sp. FL0255]
MNSLWPSRAPTDGADAAKDPIDVADTGVADIGPELTTTNNPSARPPLQRNQMSVPAPPTQPPPAAPTNQPTDSLSLAQLRRIVSEFPGAETAAYDFKYADTASHPEEIDEWFSYQFSQFVRLNNAQRAYESQWEHNMAAKEAEVTWDESTDDIRQAFVHHALSQIKSDDPAIRSSASGKLVYIVLGRWTDTATPPVGGMSKSRSVAGPGQLAAIKAGVKSIASADGLSTIWQVLRENLDAVFNDELSKPSASNQQDAQDGLLNMMTIMYISIQVTIGDSEGMDLVRNQLLSLSPCLPTYLLTAVAKYRFFEPREDAMNVPNVQALLLLWKSILLVFGGTEEIEEAKCALRETDADDKGKNTIMASPLDYHFFRQEITSKYPAYLPPQSKIPLDAGNTSLLPRLPNHPTRNNGSNGILPAPPGMQSGGASILHQPVHIATPAPSPPPSPAIGGKGGKKQNYQTNQNFPFMYPPLDETSNSAGGKGAAGQQDALVGRKWEGSSVPASILEAGELFSKRVRMTRATRQLWEERQRFQKYERGWDRSDEEDSDEIKESDLDALGEDDEHIDTAKLLEFIENRHKKKEEPKIDIGPNEDIPEDIKRRLEAVETFYKTSLPQLQSLVIVLMKGILSYVTTSISNAPLVLPSAPGAVPPREPSVRPVWNRSVDAAPVVNGSMNQDSAGQINDADVAGRWMEIECKAATGILLMLLKWLKVSHILKFEYLTQLLLDSNYLPLVLKLFAHQDIQQAVDSKADRIEHSFFHFCNQRACPGDNLLTEPTEIDVADDESEDEAAPPPIKRRRSPAGSQQPQGEDDDPSKKPEEQASTRPEVDELGYPVNPLPNEPITDFSWRNFFALINYLRIMQKICKHKAHRNLLLVQYKSSNIIRKCLKIPQNELRLYTLKLFKNQVPYCGRKWRQSNMRVITAVYLHCRPELRDEWLAGSDVDAEVEDALPLEQALRSLTHWFNVRRYPDQMAPEIKAALREQQDFFTREVERLEIWNVFQGGAGSQQDESVNGDWEHASAAGPSWG